MFLNIDKHKKCLLFLYIGRVFLMCAFHKKNYGRKIRLWCYKLGKGSFSMHQENPKTLSGTMRYWQKHYPRDNWRIREEELLVVETILNSSFIRHSFTLRIVVKLAHIKWKFSSFEGHMETENICFLSLWKHRSYLAEEQMYNSKQTFLFCFDNYFWSFIPRLFWQAI